MHFNLWEERILKKHFRIVALSILLLFSAWGSAMAHFGMIIPSKQMVVAGEGNTVNLKVMFAHPVERVGLDLEKPAAFGVFHDGKMTDLLDALAPARIMGKKAWEMKYQVKKPGVYTFCMEPKPYFEPAEDIYIVHYTKVVVAAFGLEEGWDREAGLRTEIVPLSRPFGLYGGNVFQGIVKVQGKPVPYADVEVEYYRTDDAKGGEKPNEYMVTQVVKADGNGVFTYGVPKAGWWGFAALNTDDRKIEGKEVEIGAVIWVHFIEMK
jgi:cobalt/nickel transport protein